MAVFTFTGDPRAPGTDPASCELYGTAFTLGEPVEVIDPATVAKLRRHNHFTESDDGGTERGYRAVHVGFGRYVVVFGDEDQKVVKGLSKSDADAFNELSDEDKAQALTMFEAA